MKKVLSALLSLAFLISLSACDKPDSKNVKGNAEPSTNASAGTNQSVTAQSAKFDAHENIVKVGENVIYKKAVASEDDDFGFSFVLYNEATGNEKELAIPNDTEFEVMYFTGSKLYVSGLYLDGTVGEYDIETDQYKHIKLSDSYIGIIFIDENYIYYQGFKEEDIRDTIPTSAVASYFKYDIKTGETTEFLTGKINIDCYNDFGEINLPENHLIYYTTESGTIIDNDYKELYTYNFESGKSYKIADNAVYSHNVGDTLYYISLSDSTLHKCSFKGENHTKVIALQTSAIENIEIKYCYLSGNESHLFAYGSETYTIYSWNLKDGICTPITSPVDGFMTVLTDNDKIYSLDVHPDSSVEYDESEKITVYDISNGVENKALFADDIIFIEDHMLRIKNNKIYTFTPDFEKMVLDFEIIPAQ